MLAVLSRGEHRGQFVKERIELVAEDLDCLAESAAFGERRVHEVAAADAERGGDCVANPFEPRELFRGEVASGVLLMEQPGVVSLLDAVGERDELVVLVYGEADERDEVSEDMPRRSRVPWSGRGPGMPAIGAPGSTAAAASRSRSRVP